MFGTKGRRGFLKTAGAAFAALSASSKRVTAVENEVTTAVTLIRGIEGKEQELEAHLLSLSDVSPWDFHVSALWR